MASIRELFDSSRALNRPIEKVITYQNRSEAQLRAEISEYVVTANIEENFEDLLKKMQMAQQGGGGGQWSSCVIPLPARRIDGNHPTPLREEIA